MKAVLQPDHIPLNKFRLLVPGLPEFTFLSVSGLDTELNVVDLPDRTKASGGRRNPQEFTVTLPMHHEVEQAAMQLWLREGTDPVSPLYKKIGTLLIQSISDQREKSYTLIDLFPGKESLPDFEMDNDGELAMNEWTMHSSDMLPSG